MSFLTLTTDLRRECSVSGDGPTAVTGQTGEYNRLVEWIQSAHEEIQAKWNDWAFLWKEESFSTIADQADYDLTDSGDMGGAPNVISDFNEFAMFQPSSGLVGPKIWIDTTTDQLTFIPWSEYDQNAYSGTQKPYEFTITPAGKFKFLPTPDAIYSVTFEYYRTPYVMAADADVPLIPTRFQRAIVARAMVYYGNYESAPEVKEDGVERYNEAMAQMEASQLPSSSEHRYSTNNNIVISAQ